MKKTSEEQLDIIIEVARNKFNDEINNLAKAKRDYEAAEAMYKMTQKLKTNTKKRENNV